MKKRKTFKHSSNSRNEAAMMRLRIAHGAAGYGVYFMLVEQIHQFGKPLDAEQLDILAYELHCPLEQLTSVLQDFGLFVLTKRGYVLPGQEEEEEQAEAEAEAVSDCLTAEDGCSTTSGGNVHSNAAGGCRSGGDPRLYARQKT